MQFTSLAFIGFFAVVFAFYWRTKHENRWAISLLASLIFYVMLGFGAFAVLLICIVASYFMGILLSKTKSKPWLFACVFVSLVPLLSFKYFDSIFEVFGKTTNLSLLTPVGISFFTFKIVAYLVEIFKGNILAETHFGKYALYVSFFPEVSSGPIQRPLDLIGQINTEKTFNKQLAIQGAQLMLWGFFKKLVIADNLAHYVNVGFTQHLLIMGPSIILAAILYSFQLYCDFSGYSDIAIGAMNLLGFSVPNNFKSPYFAVSIKDFWARWHISLSTFLRDYVYFPLGGSHKGLTRTCVNLLITFFISGIWHGTGLQFIVWGMLHGIFQVVGRLTQPVRSKMWKISHISEQSKFAIFVKTIITFALVTIAWVFFGASSLEHALILFVRMTDSFGFSIQTWKNAMTMLDLNTGMLLRIGSAGALLFVVDFLSRNCGFTAWLTGCKKWVQACFCYVLVFYIAFFGAIGASSFIYFQF